MCNGDSEPVEIIVAVMSVEIEHKYLVTDDSYKAMSECRIDMAQGYLSRVAERTVRVRVAGDRAWLTVKGRNDGDTRLEFEYEIPAEDGRRLLQLCDGPVLYKTRWYVTYKGYRWEVDEFQGALSPLVMAEIELKVSSHSYPLPSFVGKDVTGNPEYYNSELVRRLMGG